MVKSLLSEMSTWSPPYLTGGLRKGPEPNLQEIENSLLPERGWTLRTGVSGPQPQPTGSPVSQQFHLSHTHPQGSSARRRPLASGVLALVLWLHVLGVQLYTSVLLKGPPCSARTKVCDLGDSTEVVRLVCRVQGRQHRGHTSSLKSLARSRILLSR